MVVHTYGNNYELRLYELEIGSFTRCETYRSLELTPKPRWHLHETTAGHDPHSSSLHGSTFMSDIEYMVLSLLPLTLGTTEFSSVRSILL